MKVYPPLVAGLCQGERQPLAFPIYRTASAKAANRQRLAMLIYRTASAKAANGNRWRSDLPDCQRQPVKVCLIYPTASASAKAAMVETAGVPDLPDCQRQPVKVCLIYSTGPRQRRQPLAFLIYSTASASR